MDLDFQLMDRIVQRDELLLVFQHVVDDARQFAGRGRDRLCGSAPCLDSSVEAPNPSVGFARRPLSRSSGTCDIRS